MRRKVAKGSDAGRQLRTWIWFAAARPSFYGAAISIAVLLMIWVWPRFSIPAVDTDNPHLLYFFSTIAQALAAILALVFTISLVIAQMASQYSFRLSSRFFDLPTVSYIALFGAGVLLPVWEIGAPTPIGARISLSIAFVCVIFLVPYFLSFRRRLDPSAMLADLYSAVVRAVKRGQTEEPAGARLIQSIARSACGLRDYETYATGLARLGEAYIAAEYANCSDALTELRVRFRDSCLSTIGDAVALLRSIDAFRALGAAALQAKLPTAVEGVSKEFGLFAVSCLEHSIDAGVDNSVIGIGTLGADAAKRQLRDASLTAINQLKIIGARVLAARKDSTACPSPKPRPEGKWLICRAVI